MADDENLKRKKLWVFLLTFFSYTFTHAGRKIFSNVKTAMGSTWIAADITPSEFGTSAPNVIEAGMSNVSIIPKVDPFLDSVEEVEVFFGMLDTLFLLSYAVGLYLGGTIGDRVDLRVFLSQGMIVSALMLFMFGAVSEWIQVYSRIYYLTFWILNGLSQGYSWPALVAVMGNWYGTKNRGLIFGLWSSSSTIGNLLGACIVSVTVESGYEYSFLVSSILMFLWGFVLLIFLCPSPETTEISGDGTPLASNGDKKPIGFISAILLPGVILYSLCYCFLKMVNYSLLFWLPFYLNNHFGWEEIKADRHSMFYDVGGTFGGPFIGWLSDLAGRRSPAVVITLAFSMVSLFAYNMIPAIEWLNALGLCILGFLIAGVAHLVSSTVPADLGQQEQIKDNRAALSTVTGIVDGTGTIGAAIGQVILPVLLVGVGPEGGWNAIFYFLSIMTVCAILCVFPIFLNDMSAICWPGAEEMVSSQKLHEDSVKLKRYDALSDTD